MNLLGGKSAIEHDDSPRVEVCEFEKPVSNAGMKVQILFFKARFIQFLRFELAERALDSGLRIDIEDKGVVGFERKPGAVLDSAEQIARQSAGVSLIRDRAVMVAIAKHKFTLFQTRLEKFGDVLKAIGQV